MEGANALDGQPWAAFMVVWRLNSHTHTSLTVAKRSSTKHYLLSVNLYSFAWKTPHLLFYFASAYSLYPSDPRVQALSDLIYWGLSISISFVP